MACNCSIGACCTRHLGTSYIANPPHRVLVPRAGQKIVICLLGDQPNQFSICGATHSSGQQPDFLAVDIRYDVSTRLINLTLFEECQHDAVPLCLQLKYEPLHSHAPIHEAVEGHNKRIKEFYWQLWYANDKEQDAEEFLRLYLDALDGELPVLLASTSGRRSASAELKVERGVSQSGQTRVESQGFAVRQLLHLPELNLGSIRNAWS